jgi:hypothetical protein
MTDDQIIDKILNHLYEADGCAIYVASLTTEILKLDDRAYTAFVDKLDSEGLAKPLEPRHRMIITEKGREIYKAGGWLSYIDKKQKEDNIIQLTKKLERHNLKLDIFNKYLFILGKFYIVSDCITAILTKGKFGLLSYLINQIYKQ